MLSPQNKCGSPTVSGLLKFEWSTRSDTARELIDALLQLLSFMHALATFFHQGYELMKDQEPFLKKISAQVSHCFGKSVTWLMTLPLTVGGATSGSGGWLLFDDVRTRPLQEDGELLLSESWDQYWWRSAVDRRCRTPHAPRSRETDHWGLPVQAREQRVQDVEQVGPGVCISPWCAGKNSGHIK